MTAPAAKAPSDNAPHILVVDDDERIRDLLGRYLLDHGYRTTTASSSHNARNVCSSLMSRLSARFPT